MRRTDVAKLALATAVTAVGAGLLVTPGRAVPPATSHAVLVQPARLAARHAAPRPVAHVVALGDSVATGADCSCDGYPRVLAAELANNRAAPADVINDAVNGLTTGGLLQQLQDPAVRADLAPATVVTLTIGANDFNEADAGTGSCTSPDLACYQQPLAALPGLVGSALRAVHAAAPHARLVVTDYWNVFQDGDVAAQQGAAAVTTGRDLTARVNAVLADAGRAGGATVVDLDAPFHAADPTPLLTPDGDHPSAAGAAVIAHAVAAAVSSGA